MRIIFTMKPVKTVRYPKPNPMSWYNLLGFVCIISYLLPVGVIIYNGFYKHRSLAALAIYFTIVAGYNFMAEDIIQVSKVFLRNFGILTNYLDVPLMMTALLFFCADKQKQKNIFWLIGVFIAYELFITYLIGYKPVAIIYIMGPGIVVILVYTFYLFVRQVKFSLMHRKNQGRIVMLASILFAYACYSLIYYFYYIQKTPYKEDVQLLYNIASIISSGMMAIGLHLMRKRMKELQMLKITRKELALFFAN